MTGKVTHAQVYTNDRPYSYFIDTTYFEDTIIKSSLLFGARDINSPLPQNAQTQLTSQIGNIQSLTSHKLDSPTIGI
ncbi:hypothetical protein BCON_0438g00010 [Botryotinia convoluta]|uniref:Uncharacterized protein n=1 Tax=Botryotinia convoluta TaxID=54673 RepID=A0A4Z1H7B8_9HELO|nr:hypothetical protein BCON_0438g00010 [Botryotinia convoluta]